MDKYFETLTLVNNIVGTIESKRFGKTRFLAFYQPYKVPSKFLSAHEEIKERIVHLEYAFDVSSEYQSLGDGVYSGGPHVNQEARNLMGAKIAQIVVQQILSD